MEGGEEQTTSSSNQRRDGADMQQQPGEEGRSSKPATMGGGGCQGKGWVRGEGELLRSRFPASKIREKKIESFDPENTTSRD